MCGLVNPAKAVWRKLNWSTKAKHLVNQLSTNGTPTSRWAASRPQIVREEEDLPQVVNPRLLKSIHKLIEEDSKNFALNDGSANPRDESIPSEGDRNANRPEIRRSKMGAKGDLFTG